jgi:hypothetical protein
MLAAALRAEVVGYRDRFTDQVDGHGRRLVAGNGYHAGTGSGHRVSKIANLAIDQDLTLKQAGLRSGVSEELFDRVVIPENLTRPGTADAPTDPASRCP